MSYLTFVEQNLPGLKTLHVEVRSTTHGDLLGCIKWFGRWRQYAFFPESGTVWNPDCLREVTERMASLMAARRTQRAAQ
jgi:hypothetical protein